MSSALEFLNALMKGRKCGETCKGLNGLLRNINCIRNYIFAKKVGKGKDVAVFLEDEMGKICPFAYLYS